MSVGLSLVGFQPSATAAALKTWMRAKGRLDRVFLLATARVRQEGQAQRLKELCEKWGCPVDVLPIGDKLDPGQSPPSAPAVVRQVLANLGQGSRVVFFGDPGPKFLVASVAQVLPPDTIFLHADTAHLHCGTFEDGQEHWERHELESLGMDNLLALYGLQGKTDATRVSQELRNYLNRHRLALPERIHPGFQFRGLNLPALDLAFERGGWFFGLCWVDKLEEVRAVERISHALQGLRPVLALVAKKKRILTHIQAARLHAISPTSGQALRDWIEGRVLPPGYDLIPDAKKPFRSLKSCQGCGGSGLPLVVWLGTDPSATLVSLYTHRPRQAWVLYDSQTPVAVEMLRRLREVSSRLPVGQLTFVASDFLGRRTVSLLGQQLGRGLEVKADISPGRKAQGVALGRLPGVQLWSLHTRQGEAVPLLRGPDSLPFQGPDLLTQTRMNGGRLARAGVDAKAWAPNFVDFLNLLGRFLATKLEEDPKIRTALSPLSTMECSRGRLSVKKDVIEVEYDVKRKKHTLDPEGGYWFERVVAAALVAAGADEVRVGVRWAWPPGAVPPTEHWKAAFRDEADVVTRFGPRFFVISCKVGSKPSHARVARDVEAVALRCVGRLAVPLVIRPWIDPAILEERKKISRGAAFLHLPSLCEPEQLRQTLNELWSVRSTLGE
jgi:hypothetical protein